MKKIDREKQQRLEKFLKEHPDFYKYSPSQLELLKFQAQRRDLKLKRLKEICELYYKNYLSYSEIANKFGVSRQRIHQIIDEYEKKNKI